MSEMEEQQSLNPKVEELTIKIKINSTLDDISKKLSTIPLYLFSYSNDTITLAKVESRNIKKEPYLFHIFTIKQDELKITYSLPHEISERVRRANISRYLIELILYINDYISIDLKELLPFIDSSIDNLLGALNVDYTQLLGKYEYLLASYTELKKLADELANSNRNLTIEASRLSDENKSLKEEIDALLKYSDESLMIMVEEWLESHNNLIDIEEFSKANSVPMPRVEQILNKMVSLGYLEIKG